MNGLARRISDQVFQTVPGLLLLASIAFVAFFLKRLEVLAAISPLMIGIVLGMAFHNLVGTPAWARPAINFSVRRLLRAGVILLGAQLTLFQVAELGITGAVVVVLSVAVTFGFTVWCGRILAVDRKLTALIAVGTSICGASAVVASNTVVRAPEEDVVYAVACVTIFGTVLMFLYPLLPNVLGLPPHEYGFWTGASIHEVAQVVGAAFQAGDEPAQFAVVTKLTRVALLAPMVLLIGSLFARGQVTTNPASAGKLPKPWFIFLFLALVVLNTIFPIPEALKSHIAQVAALFFTLALVGLGLDTDFVRLKARGIRPLLVGAIGTAFIALLTLFAIKLTT